MNKSPRESLGLFCFKSNYRRNKMADELVDTVLDELEEKISVESLKILDSILPHISNELRVKYFARSFAEILSVIITSAPAHEAQEICNNICAFLQKAVEANVQLESIMKISFDDDLSGKLKASFVLNTKASA